MQKLSPERWKPVNGFEGLYEVSDSGRVRSLERLVKTRRGFSRKVPARLLKLWKQQFGYNNVALSADGVVTKALVHRLVLLAFVGPPPIGMEARHLNGNPSDSRLGNLQWSTHLENLADKIIHGTIQRGERAGGAKLKKKDIIFIRKSPVTQMKLAKQLGVSQQLISQIRTGRVWKHV